MADVFNLQGSISLDTSGFMSGIQQAAKSAESMNKSVESVGKTVSDSQKSIDNAAKSMSVLGTNVTHLDTPFTTLRNKLEAARSATADAQKKVDDLTRDFNEYAKTTGTASDDTKTLYEALKNAEKQLEHCKKAENNAQKAIDDYNNSTDKSTDSTDKATQATKELGKEAENTGKKFVDFGDILKANVIGDLIVDGIRAVIETVKQLGDTAVKAVTDFTKSSVTVGMSFDSSMSKVAATMGMTTDELQDQVGEVDLAWGHFSGNLREFAKEMGKNTAFSATEAAQALNYMALAGYDAQKSMDMLPTVLNLAAAGGMQLSRASDMITDTQTALGLSTERTTQLVNEMAKTASRSNTSVEQLGNAMLTVGGNAKSLRGGMIKLEDGTIQTYDGVTELNAAFGILADNGTKASEAGTKLRNILTSLSSDKFETNITERFGISAYDDQGNMRSLRDIFSDMNKAMSGMSDKERTSLINEVFNARDKKDVIAFLDTSKERWNDLTMQIIEAGDAAQDMANTQLNNLTGNSLMIQALQQ